MKCSDLDVLASKFIRLMYEVPSYQNKYLKEIGILKVKSELSERQLKILYSLSTLDINTISELSELMNISKSTLSIIMSKMIKKGLIVKTYPTSFDDKRKVFFSLSEEGKNRLKEFMMVCIEDFRHVYDSFDNEQKENFKNGILMLNSIMLKKNERLQEIIIKSNDEVVKIVSRIVKFFINFIDTTREVCKGEFNINGNNNSLTKNQFFILVAIDLYNYNTISKLEKFFHSSGSTISITISKLVKDGYLYKIYPSEDEDGRVIYIRLTEKGIDILKETEKGLKQVIKKFIESLEENKRCELEAATDLLLSVFNNNNDLSFCY